MDTWPDLYLILRFLCLPLDEAPVPLVVRVPHFENHCHRLFDVIDQSSNPPFAPKKILHFQNVISLLSIKINKVLGSVRRAFSPNKVESI